MILSRDHHPRPCSQVRGALALHPAGTQHPHPRHPPLHLDHPRVPPLAPLQGEGEEGGSCCEVLSRLQQSQTGAIITEVNIISYHVYFIIYQYMLSLPF